MTPVTSFVRSVAHRFVLTVGRVGAGSRPCGWGTGLAVAMTPLFALAIASGALGAQVVSASKPVRTLIGDVAIILRTDRPGTLRIGVAGANRSLTLSVRSTDARRWADSAAKLVAPAPKRRGKRATASTADTSVRRRAVLEEPGVGAGTFVLLRIDSAATRRFLLFVDDARLDGIRQPLEPEEAKLLIRLVRGATPPVRGAPPKNGGAKSGRKGSVPTRRGSGAKPSAGAGARSGQPSTESSSLSRSPSSAGTPLHGR